MTDPSKPINPLMARPAGALAPRMEIGSSQARQQLQDHCDTLNRHDWVRASGRPYLLGKAKDGKLVVIRKGETMDDAA